MHAGDLYKGEYRRSSRYQVMNNAPIPRNEFERIGYSREEYQSDGEEGDKQYRCFGVGIPSRQGQPEEGGCKDIGSEQYCECTPRSCMGYIEDEGKRTYQKERKESI